MWHVLDTLISVLEEGKSVVLGTIVRSSGSVPRSSGARMLVLADGSFVGSVGGGAVEGACQAGAKELFLSLKKYAVLNFELSAATAAEKGMICGGSVTILLQKIEPDTIVLFQKLRHAYGAGLRPLLLTLLPAGEVPPCLLTFGAGQDNRVAEKLQTLLAEKPKHAPFIIFYDDQEIFVEPLIHPGVVYLAGAGHVAMAVAHLAAYTGFEIVVMDDRPEFANTERYPEARQVQVLENFDTCFTKLTSDDYVVIVTRGHQYDRDVLAQALRTDAGYIGMIGSNKKRKAVYASLLEAGFTESDLQRVHSPIGIAIGANTPEEIGVSIVAELIQVRAGRK